LIKTTAKIIPPITTKIAKNQIKNVKNPPSSSTGLHSLAQTCVPEQLSSDPEYLIESSPASEQQIPPELEHVGFVSQLDAHTSLPKQVLSSSGNFSDPVAALEQHIPLSIPHVSSVSGTSHSS